MIFCVKSPVEIGAKLDINVVNGYTWLETVSFDAYNEAMFLIQTIERYKERVEVERNIGLAKQKYGLDLIHLKLQNTTAGVIALSIVVLNLRKIQSAFYFWLFSFERLRGCRWKYYGVVKLDVEPGSWVV